MPATAFSEQPDLTAECGNLDPYAGTARDSAARLSDQALSALQFSRWANYDFDESVHTGMDREHYATALGVLSARFGDAVLADSAIHTITKHLQHPAVFHAAVDHLQGVGPEFTQTHGMYIKRGVVNPVKLLAEYFPAAHAAITSERPDFVPTSDSLPALSVERL